MLVYLLRHGDSQTDASIPDQVRALTPDGAAAVQYAAHAILLLGLAFDAVYSSPLLRAQQTSELALSRLPHKPSIQVTDHLKVGADFQKLFDLLNTHPAETRILLVGHEPYFSQLLSTLLTGSLDAKVDIKKGSLSCVEVSSPVKPRAGTLKWILTPLLIGLIAT